MSSSKVSFKDAPAAEYPIPPCAQEVWHYVPPPKKRPALRRLPDPAARTRIRYST